MFTMNGVYLVGGWQTIGPLKLLLLLMSEEWGI